VTTPRRAPLRRKASRPRSRSLQATARTALAGPRSPGGWHPFIVRDHYPGAWQHNDEIVVDNVLASPAVFICVTKIMADVGKVRLRLVAFDDGVWSEVYGSPLGAVLEKPNHYQTRIKFVEAWIGSKLLHGNTYALKVRNGDGDVAALHVLDPTRVTPLVTPSGAVYYRLQRDDLSGVGLDTIDVDAGVVVVPANEIIHDLMYALFHPLVGIAPLYACGLAAQQQTAMQRGSQSFFANGAQPGGILTAPGAISDETALRLKEHWETAYTGDNYGKVAVLGDGLKYEKVSLSAMEAQLVDQLNWSGTTICGTYGMPPYLAGIGPAPPFGIPPLLQLYYNECLQPLFTSMEVCLDEGLELPKPYGTEFDIDDLVWLDINAKTTAAAEGIKGGGMSPDEARRRYYGLGSVVGGDTPYMQQQMFALAALAERDAEHPFSKAAPAAPAAPAVTVDEKTVALARAAFVDAALLHLNAKGITTL
jgi:HK97 family phage portal protein